MPVKLKRRDFIITSVLSGLSVACNPTNLKKNTAETLPSPPLNPQDLRVIALEWTYVENLLALGLQPVGVADIRGYQKYVKIQPQLADWVTEVGTRQEPSLEAIAQLQPDLILGIEFRHEPIYKTLSSLAKTLLFNPYPEPGTGNQFDEMQQTLRQIAQACNRSNQAEEILKNLQTTLKTSTEKLQAANLTRNTFLLGQFVPELRLFTQNSLAVQILEKIGLKNTWEGKLDRFGFNTVGLEALPPLEKNHFLYIAEGDRIPQQPFQNNPVWKNLDFVKENRLHSLGEDTWVFGGCLSAQILAEKVTQILTNKIDA